jgi:hypothetical protein
MLRGKHFTSARRWQRGFFPKTSRKNAKRKGEILLRAFASLRETASCVKNLCASGAICGFN